MRIFFDILVIVLSLSLLIYALYSIITRKDIFESKAEKKLKKSLEEDYIVDPETGVKLTLEEAESGKWLAHDNEFRTIPQKELDKLANENEKQVEIALNYLRESRFFIKKELKEKEERKLGDTKILSGYDDWFYSDIYEFKNGFIFLPNVEWNKDAFYNETHLMVWIKIDSINGHYLFREKTSSERFFDLIRSDDEIKLKDYECFTIKKSFNIIKINTILNKIIPNKGLEIEMYNDNLFIKTLKLVNLDDVKRIEHIIQKLS